MSPEILELYVFIHYNYQYEFMMPSIDEIVKTYIEMFGAEQHKEDIYETDEEEDNDEGGNEE